MPDGQVWHGLLREQQMRRMLHHQARRPDVAETSLCTRTSHSLKAERCAANAHSAKRPKACFGPAGK